MPSDRFNAAHLEMQSIVDRLAEAADSGNSSAAEAALDAASPEARMMFWSNSVTVMMGLRPDSPESIQEQVAHLMNGEATLNDLKADIESMSPEGQQHALFLLTHHPAPGVRQIGGVLEAVVGVSGSSLPATATVAAPTKRSTPASFATSGSSKNGNCYVATAIYGSYDCPEVWVLRRFRDQFLARSTAGRLGIRLYYSASPALLRLTGNHGREALRRPIAALVAHLRARGYSNAPYED